MKVYEIYSGQPKRFGLTIVEQIVFMGGIIPPMVIQVYWLLAVFPFASLILVKLLTQDEENILLKLRNLTFPSFWKGEDYRHTFMNTFMQ